MGKGDIKTRRGKLFRGTFGKRRPSSKNKKSGSVSNDIAPKKIKEPKAAAEKEIKKETILKERKPIEKDVKETAAKTEPKKEETAEKPDNEKIQDADEDEVSEEKAPDTSV